MKINDAVFTPFMGYMKSTGHNERKRTVVYYSASDLPLRTLSAKEKP